MSPSSGPPANGSKPTSPTTARTVFTSAGRRFPSGTSQLVEPWRFFRSNLPAKAAAMRRNNVGLSLLTILLVTRAFAQAPQPGKAPTDYGPYEWVDSDRTEPPRTKFKAFASQTIKQDVSYFVYLPPDYEQ